jgi:hypothetical protein
LSLCPVSSPARSTQARTTQNTRTASDRACSRMRDAPVEAPSRPAALAPDINRLTSSSLTSSSSSFFPSASAPRRDRYRLKDDLWYEAVKRNDRTYARWTQTLAGGVKATGPDSAAGARLEDTRRFFEFVRAEAPAMDAPMASNPRLTARPHTHKRP